MALLEDARLGGILVLLVVAEAVKVAVLAAEVVALQARVSALCEVNVRQCRRLLRSVT